MSHFWSWGDNLGSLTGWSESDHPVSREFLRGRAACAQIPQTERSMAFGEADASFVCNQRAVIEFGWSQVQGSIEQELASGRFEQVFAADNFGNVHGGIVDDDGELIGGEVIVTPNDKVSEIGSGDEFVESGATVDK